MTEKVIIAGSGGQGIMLSGKILVEAALIEGKFVTWLPAYGAEVRGGAAHCMSIISDEEIGSPYIDKADTLIIMNQVSLTKFKNRIKDKGLLIINSSLANLNGSVKAKTLKGSFSDIASGLGNIKTANMVALGSYLAQKNIVSQESVLKVMAKIAPKNKPELLKINQEALIKGMELVKNG